jgi:PAS domain S-box-containing protein
MKRTPGRHRSDARHLVRSANCLASVIALRSTWAGASRSHVCRTLVETLFGGLDLDLVYVRFDGRGDDAPALEGRSTVEISADAIDAELRDRFGSDLKLWPRSDSLHFGSRKLSLATVPLDLAGELGILVAASRRPHFPKESEASVLDASVSQLLLALHEERRPTQEQRPPTGRETVLDLLLATSEPYLRLLLNGIPALVSVVSPKGEVLAVNDQLLRYFGATLEQIKGWKSGVFSHEDDMAFGSEAFAQSIATGNWLEVEVRARRFDGAYRWIRTYGAPIRDVSGRIVLWCTLFVDVDDRKRAQEELAASERDLRLIVDSMPGMVAVCSARGELETVNNRVFEYFGATLDQFKQWMADWETGGLVHEDDSARTREIFTRTIATGTWTDHEYRLRRSDGTYRWFRSHMAPHRDASGRVVRWYNLLIDVHDRKLAESELRRAHDSLAEARSELERASRAMSLGILAASIAHEINQPLSGIVTNASTCLRLLAADPPDLDGALETARRSIRDGHRASDIVTRLRTLFANKEFAAAPINLNETARHVVALMLNELQRNGVALRFELAHELPFVTGDHVQLQQVILNLLLNASDAMRSVEHRARQIVIETVHDVDTVRLAVRDTGVGIPPDSLGKLFDAFFTTKADGMGIGLSVSRSIVERHGGRLWATANEGPGATFAFAIPVARGD